jgi:peptidoglycan-associated lipoprotein
MERRFVARIAVAAAIAGIVVVGCKSTPETTDDGTRSGEWSQGKETDGREGAGPFSVPELVTVYFDYDKSNVREDQRPTLQGNAEAIRTHTEWRTVIIEGHCDERGSEEYNLALGERRAEAVKKYLVNLGTPAARVDTVSFGESRPVAFGHDESAWRLNRRGDFKVTR